MESKDGIAKFQEMSKDWENNPKILRKIIENLSEKIDELQAKASAYDRLMSGKATMTLKEMANFKGFPITIDSDWTIKSHGAEPKMVEMPHGTGFWVNDADDEEEIDESFVEIPEGFDWTTSLTLPDGWEER